MEQENRHVFNIGKQIAMLFRAGHYYYTHRIQNMDLGGGQMSLIFHLYAHNGASQDELTKMLEVDKATVTRMINKLEEHDVVSRQKDDQDHRVNRIVLTEKGLALRSELREAADFWEETLLKGLDDTERAHLEHLFDKMTQNVRDYKNKQNQDCRKG